jgi:hypothetical protein
VPEQRPPPARAASYGKQYGERPWACCCAGPGACSRNAHSQCLLRECTTPVIVYTTPVSLHSRWCRLALAGRVNSGKAGTSTSISTRSKAAAAHRQGPHKGELLPEVGAHDAARSAQAVPLRFLSQVTQSRLLRSLHDNKATTSRADRCVDALHTCGGAVSFAFFGFFAFFATLSPQTTRAGWRAAEVQSGSPQTR